MGKHKFFSGPFDTVNPDISLLRYLNTYFAWIMLIHTDALWDRIIMVSYWEFKLWDPQISYMIHEVAAGYLITLLLPTEEYLLSLFLYKNGLQNSLYDCGFSAHRHYVKVKFISALCRLVLQKQEINWKCHL